MRWIHPLSDITVTDTELVGGKAAHLGAMLRAGFPVPPGFVIDVNAFISHFGEATEPLVRPNAPRLQAELMSQVVEALVTHLGDQAELAVRSSSVAEDSEWASFAGQHATYYFVSPSQLDQAISDCWMSLWSEAALAYRRANASELHSGDPVRMAVIVQQMLPADRSGVAFSRDPVTPNSHDCVIEATWGLGAALVDGRVTPDRFRVNEDGQLINQRIADKQVLVDPKPSNPDGKRVEEVPAERRKQPVLDQQEAERIANITHQLETLFEQPQDVEWAYVDDQLYLLQSRAITSLPADPPTDQLVAFKPLLENFTDPLTPMSEDLFAQVLPRVGRFVEGHLYLDMSNLQALSPLQLSAHEMAETALLRHKPHEQPDKNTNWLGLLKGGAVVAASTLIAGALWIRSGYLSVDGLGRYRDLVERVRNDPKLDAAASMRQLFLGEHMFKPIAHHIILMNVSAARYFVYTACLQRLVQRFAPDYPVTRLPQTYHGMRDMYSISLLERIQQLGELLEQALADDGPEARRIQQVLQQAPQATTSTLPPKHPFTLAYTEFLHDYGHRGAKEMELASPRWRETPATLLRLIRSSVDSAIDNDRNHANVLAARDELHQQLPRWLHPLANWLMSNISKYTALRENTRYFHIMGFDVVRDKLLASERDLIRQGHLSVSGDIFFLRHAELVALLNGELAPQSAQLTVRLRRRRWRAACKARAPETYNVHYPIKPSTDDTNTDTLRGYCASPGVTEGTARVILDLHHADQLASGEILVTAHTDPAWTPLFTRAAAVIVATGSYLSHAGTVARELHIPCVVDVARCVELIPDGQPLRVDASNGVVELLS